MRAGTFDDDAIALWEFARCQRPDGSYYGTKGQCRKGKEVGAKEISALKKAAAKGNKKASLALEVVEGKKTKAEARKELSKAPKDQVKREPKKKKEGAYSPKESKGQVGIKSQFEKGAFGDRSSAFDPKSFDEKIERVNTSKKKKSEKNKLIKELELERSQAEQNLKFLTQLEKNLSKENKIEVASNGIVSISSKTKSGDSVVSTFSPQMGFAFKVNDSFNAGSVTDRAAQIQVASQVRSQYDALVKSLPVGHVVKTSAWTDDGKGEMRQRAYEKMGFSKGTPGNTITAVKQSDGTMAPGAPGNKGWGKHEDQKKKSDSVWFAEGGKENLWMQVVFGKEE